jgi:hypothetical protein
MEELTYRDIKIGIYKDEEEFCAIIGDFTSYFTQCSSKSKEMVESFAKDIVDEMLRIYPRDDSRFNKPGPGPFAWTVFNDKRNNNDEPINLNLSFKEK